MSVTFKTFKCITKGKNCIVFYVTAAKLKMRGLVYRPGHGHMVICGWGWEGGDFVINVEPLAFPQAVA